MRSRLNVVALHSTVPVQPLSSMRAQNRLQAFPRDIGSPSQDLLVRFSELILELSQALAPLDLVQKLADHAIELSAATNALVLLVKNGEWEIAAVSPAKPAKNNEVTAAAKKRIASRLSRLAAKDTNSFAPRSAAEVLGQDLAKTLGWKELALVSLTQGEQAPLGLIVLVDPSIRTDDVEIRLKALSRHAAVVLENGRLFARVEQSRRNWVKDFDAITDFIVVHNAENVILRVNRSLAEFLRVPLPDLLGKRLSVLSPLCARMPRGGCPFCRDADNSLEDTLHAPNGRTYLVSTSHIPGGLSGGLEEEQRTIHVLKDITDRKELERRYEELFDNIQEGLFFCTPDGQFLEVNGALVRMLGYSTPEELLKLNLFEHLCLQTGKRHSFRREVEKNGIIQNHEEILHRKDGTVIHVLQNLLAVRDARGNIVQYHGLMLDVTERKMFEAQLQRERDFNKNILNDTQSMILVLDTAGLVSYANRRCFQAGQKRETLLGKPLADKVPADSRKIISGAIQRAINGVAVDGLELPVCSDDGRTAQFSVSLSPMRDEHGNINSLVAVMTDITDALDLQAKLMHTEKMAAVGQLVAGVAHEVNNPLAAISGFTELLLENPSVPHSAKEELRVILNETLRTKTIVQDLLSFARQTPTQREPVEINVVVRQTVKLRSYDLLNRQIAVVEDLGESVPVVIGDSHQLQQVFLNILNNAYDAVQETERPGRIEISTRFRDGHVEILFRDNGPGISNVERIFEPFFTTKEVGKGTGLGLSICYGIVRGHGGEILCQNNNDSPGCTFTVRLPIATVEGLAEMAAG